MGVVVRKVEMDGLICSVDVERAQLQAPYWKKLFSF
jgi:hypothetical protein